MKHTIKDIADLLGVTTHNLRYYDKMELISPEINAENGYRYYSLLDTRRFNLIRYYRSMGLSIEEIKELLEGTNSFNEQALLDRLHKEIITNYMTLDSIKEYSNFINYMNDNFDNISVIEVPAFIRVDFSHNNILVKDKSILDLRDELLLYPSISKWVSSININKLLNEDVLDFNYGIHMKLDSAIALGIDVTKYKIVNSRRCLLSFYKKDNKHEYCMEDFDTIINFIKENCLNVENMYIGTISSEGIASDYLNYNYILCEVLD